MESAGSAGGEEVRAAVVIGETQVSAHVPADLALEFEAYVRRAGGAKKKHVELALRRYLIEKGAHDGAHTDGGSVGGS